MKVNTAAKIESEPSVCFFLFFFPLRLIVSHRVLPSRAWTERLSSRALSAVGLGIYGDSNSESEEEQSENAQVQNDDSDEELKVRIFRYTLRGTQIITRRG